MIYYHVYEYLSIKRPPCILFVMKTRFPQTRVADGIPMVWFNMFLSLLYFLSTGLIRFRFLFLAESWGKAIFHRWWNFLLSWSTQLSLSPAPKVAVVEAQEIYPISWLEVSQWCLSIMLSSFISWNTSVKKQTNKQTNLRNFALFTIWLLV